MKEDYFNRPKIWGLAVSETFKDLRFLFGHGINNFADIISQHRGSLHSTHNIFIQVLYDFGLFGLLISKKQKQNLVNCQKNILLLQKYFMKTQFYLIPIVTRA